MTMDPPRIFSHSQLHLSLDSYDVYVCMYMFSYIYRCVCVNYTCP